MPKLTLPLNCKIHFNHYKEGFANQEVIDIEKVEPPSEEDIEEYLWENREDWKED